MSYISEMDNMFDNDILSNMSCVNYLRLYNKPNDKNKNLSIIDDFAYTLTKVLQNNKTINIYKLLIVKTCGVIINQKQINVFNYVIKNMIEDNIICNKLYNDAINEINTNDVINEISNYYDMDKNYIIQLLNNLIQ